MILAPVVGAAVPAQAESSQQAFINEIGNSAAAVANSNDMYASVMIAQALLESSYGSSGLASAPNYNLFGVKEVIMDNLFICQQRIFRRTMGDRHSSI